jgi:CheY-like chemotaxis protein
MLLRRILVVDDNEDDLFFAQIILKAARVAVDLSLAPTGQAALDGLAGPAGREVDAILLDINMPEMSGFEFLDRYQPLYEQGVVAAPVVMLTSSSDRADRARAQAYGCVKGYWVKPMSRQQAQALPDLLGPPRRLGDAP